MKNRGYCDKLKDVSQGEDTGESMNVAERKDKVLSYHTVYRDGEGEIVEKKSRFIAVIRHVDSEEEALEMIESLRKQYWDARHHCFAYIIGTKAECVRFGDDGEPGGTAGKPMLEVLQSRKLCNVCAVVIRYFGGTLLGTGGLVRAYSGAVVEGLLHTGVIHKELAVRTGLYTDYTDLGKLQYVVAQEGLLLAGEIEYTDKVMMPIAIPVERYETVLVKLSDTTAGRVKCEPERYIYTATLGKEVLIFEE